MANHTELANISEIGFAFILGLIISGKPIHTPSPYHRLRPFCGLGLFIFRHTELIFLLFSRLLYH